ncbi:MAG: PLP-dependent aminotransferase family protein [Actinomycetota bacterium]|nr:PLP-dependent aminotransferase family protein [Actinomycetota bacterium]
MTRPTLPLSLTRRSGTRLTVQLATQVRELVRSGTLPPGTRLPSSRALAADLEVARAVVEHAYDQLSAEGWLAARRGAGTYVAAIGLLPASAVPRGDPGTTTGPDVPALVRMDTGTPWIDPRNEAGWRRAWREVSAARMPPGYPDPAGIPELRAELAAYVSRTRGLSCHPEHVMVTGGTTHGLGLLLGLLGRGSIAVEDPGYRCAVATAEQAGWDVVDVPVDAEGIDVGALGSTPADTRAVYVTPAHQHPLGTTMSAGRRIALLAEATRRDALLAEDDYDSEFRYDVAPLPALASLDPDRVVYLGTASKTVHPALRIGWLVASSDVVTEIARRRAARHDHPSWPVQRAFLAMLRDGHVDQLIRSAARVYARRSRVVTEALGPFGQVGAPPAGMYLTLPLPGHVAATVRTACRAVGFDVPSLADYCRSRELTGLVVGFGGVTDDELSRALEVMTGALATTVG